MRGYSIQAESEAWSFSSPCAITLVLMRIVKKLYTELRRRCRGFVPSLFQYSVFKTFQSIRCRLNLFCLRSIDTPHSNHEVSRWHVDGCRGQTSGIRCRSLLCHRVRRWEGFEVVVSYQEDSIKRGLVESAHFDSSESVALPCG